MPKLNPHQEAALIPLAERAVTLVIPDLDDFEDRLCDAHADGGIPCIEFQWDWTEFVNPFGIAQHEPPTEGVETLFEIASVEQDDEPQWMLSMAFAVVAPDEPEHRPGFNAIVVIDARSGVGYPDNHQGNVSVYFPEDDVQRAMLIARERGRAFTLHGQERLPGFHQMDELKGFAPDPMAAALVGSISSAIDALWLYMNREH